MNKLIIRLTTLEKDWKIKFKENIRKNNKDISELKNNEIYSINKSCSLKKYIKIWLRQLRKLRLIKAI